MAGARVILSYCPVVCKHKNSPRNSVFSFEHVACVVAELKQKLPAAPEMLFSIKVYSGTFWNAQSLGFPGLLGEQVGAWGMLEQVFTWILYVRLKQTCDSRNTIYI